MSNFPVTLQHGTINKIWLNPNVFVTADNIDDDPNPDVVSYTPVNMSKLQEDRNYFLNAGAIYSFSSPDQEEGLVMILAYDQEEDSEDIAGSDPWLDRIERRFGKHKRKQMENKWRNFNR